MKQPKKKRPQAPRVRVFPFLLDVRQEDSCMVRHESYGEASDAWHVFTVAQVMTSRKQPLKPIITLHGLIHQRIRETMRSQENIDIEFVLDEALTHLNDFWHNEFSKTDIKLIKSSTLIVGMARGEKLCIADRGASVGHMIMSGEDHKPRIVPVISPRAKSNEDIETLFESIVCGAIPVGSRIILGTSLIRNLGRNDVFMQLLSKRTTNLSEIWQRIKRKLEQKGSPHCSGVLIESFSNRAPVSHVQSKQSLSDYVARPPEPDLAPFMRAHTLIRKILSYVWRFFGVVRAFLSRCGTSLSRMCPRWLRLPGFITRSYRACTGMLAALWRLLSTNKTSRSVHQKTKTASFRVTRTFLLSLLWVATRVLYPLKSLARSLAKKFGQLSRTRKIAFSSSLVLILVFVGGLMFSRHIQQQERNAVIVESAIEEFTEHLESAESKLIFGDSLGAANALNKAEATLATIPDTEKNLVTISSLASKLTTLRTEILKEKDVALSQIVYTGDAVSPSQRHVFYLDDNLITHNQTDIVDVTRNQSVSFSSPLPVSSFTALSESGLLFISDGTIAHYQPDHTLSSITLEVDGVGTLLAGQQYGPRLYTVTSDGAILRHAPSASGFARGTTWLREDTPLSQPTDLIIDGNVYVLDNGTSIHKFFKGVREPFNSESIDPPLSNAQHIWTDADSDFLYILERARRRLVIVNKRGVMQLQYIFDRAVEDFAINEAEQTGYVVVGQNIYSFVLTHLK